MPFLVENSEIMTSLKPRYLKNFPTDFFFNFLSIKVNQFPTGTYPKFGAPAARRFYAMARRKKSGGV